MLRVLRIILMLLIAVAVPVQGYASVAMFGCGPGHHALLRTAHSIQLETADHFRTPHVHTVVGVMGAEHEHAAMSQHEDGGAVAPHGALHKEAKGSCTACASCCTAAAMPGNVVSFEPARAADFYPPSSPDSAVSFLTEGPERPPRIFLV